MAKFSGPIGFGQMTKTAGVSREIITEYPYTGDVIRNIRQAQSADQVNDNVSVSNAISIVADPFATENFHEMRYVEFMGTKWKITSVDIKYPRLILALGGVYNGK